MVEANESLKQRLRAISRRTVENGCTEAEAMAAAQLLGSLMTKHGFEQADLAEREPISEDTYLAPGKRLGANLVHVANAIASFCDCKVWQDATNSAGAARRTFNALRFFGHESDAQVAVYLSHLCYTAMRAERLAYARTHPQATNRAKHAFDFGMAKRLAERFDKMTADRGAATEGGRTGRELAVVKHALVDAAFRVVGLKLGGGGSRKRRVSDAGSFEAGRAAADRVAVNSAITRAPAGYLANY